MRPHPPFHPLPHFLLKQVLGFNQQGNKKFRFSGDATSKTQLSAFAQSLLDGTAPADFKGAPIPAEPKDEGVTVIVRDNFDSIVLDPKKDVFLEVCVGGFGTGRFNSNRGASMRGRGSLDHVQQRLPIVPSPAVPPCLPCPPLP